MELFKLNNNIYKNYKNYKTEFIVNLDEVYKWIGFSSKQNAKHYFLNILN